jgi:hypothetical protein
VDLDAAARDRLDGGLDELVHAHEPLQRDEGLDALARAVRERDVVRVGLGARDRALLAQRGDDGLARLQRGQAREALAGLRGHAPVLADRRDLLEPVGAADLEVVGVVAGRDLEGAGAELRLHVGVGDDLQPPADDREDRRLPHQPRVALVVGMDRDRRVGEHRLRAHGGDRERPVAALERVVDVVEGVGDLALLDLEVGDRRARARVPVDHVVVAVDQALGEEVDEDLLDRVRVGGVEGEALLGVVDGRAQALVLLDDRAAVLLAPLPCALDERLAPELLAARALGAQEALDLGLGGDPGVVGAEDPLRGAALHARVADQPVLDRAVERVAHVQRPGHVRGRDRDRVVLLRRAGWLGVEEPGLLPALEHARLGLCGLVTGAGLEVCAHGHAEDRRGWGKTTGCPRAPTS